jgi:tetratricopeptide (TPR) repeat protein
MRTDNIVFAVAGVVFGLLAGWVIGSQQASGRVPAATAAQTAAAAAPAGNPAGSRAAVLDEAQVKALQSVAEKEPSNARARVQLGNLYFDAERYEDAIKWYGQAIKLTPDDVDLSTDLGVCYYYLNQADRAIEQLQHSLQVDPKHTKTLLNMGIVRAFGKQDLDGAAQAWQQVMQIAPDSPEGQAAKRALDSMKSAHPGMNTTPAQKPGV